MNKYKKVVTLQTIKNYDYNYTERVITKVSFRQGNAR